MPSPSTMISGFALKVCIWLKSTITWRVASRRSSGWTWVSLVSGIGGTVCPWSDHEVKQVGSPPALPERRQRWVDLSDQRAVASRRDARDLPGARGPRGADDVARACRSPRSRRGARPASKGDGRPVGTPLTVLGGAGDPRGTTSAGLAPGRTWLVVVELVDEDGLTGHRHRGVRQSGDGGASRPARAARDGLRSLRGGARLGVDVPGDAQHRAPRRRAPCRSARSTSRSGTCSGSSWASPSTSCSAARSAPSLPAYASWLYATEDLDALAAEAAGWAAQGFTAVKQRLPYGPLEGKPGIPQERRARPHGRRRGRPGRRRDGRRLHELGRRLRDPLHPRVRGRRLRLRWLEEPLVPDDIRGSRACGASVATPIAAGEHEATRYGFRHLVEAGAVDVLQPDVNRLGGITRGPPRLGPRRDVRPRRDPAPRVRPQRAPRDHEPRDTAPRVHAAGRAPGRGGRGPDLLGRVPRRASRRGGRARHRSRSVPAWG